MLEEQQNATSIFITGGTGHVGSYLIRYLLAKGYTNIRALRRKSSNLGLLGDAADRVTWIEGTVEDLPLLEDAMQGVQQVYHTAAIISYERRYAQRMIEVNTEGTANCLHAAMFAGVERFLHFSSIAAIGRTYQREWYDEKFSWERSPLNTDYAISKFLAEQEVWRAAAEGLNTVIVNPAVILGSGFWSNGANRLLRHVWQGNPMYPVGGTGYVDVRDVAKFAIDVMERGLRDCRIIISAENWRYLDTLRLIAEHLQKKPPFIEASPLLRNLAWRYEWVRSRLTGTKPDITKYSARNSARVFAYDNQLSRTHGYEYIPIRDTLRDTCAQFLESMKDGRAAKILPLV